MKIKYNQFYPRILNKKKINKKKLIEQNQIKEN